MCFLRWWILWRSFFFSQLEGKSHSLLSICYLANISLSWRWLLRPSADSYRILLINQRPTSNYILPTNPSWHMHTPSDSVPPFRHGLTVKIKHFLEADKSRAAEELPEANNCKQEEVPLLYSWYTTKPHWALATHSLKQSTFPTLFWDSIDVSFLMRISAEHLLALAVYTEILLGRAALESWCRYSKIITMSNVIRRSLSPKLPMLAFRFSQPSRLCSLFS